MEIFLFGSDANSIMEMKNNESSSGYAKSNNTTKRSQSSSYKEMKLKDREIIHQKPQDFHKVLLVHVYAK